MKPTRHGRGGELRLFGAFWPQSLRPHHAFLSIVLVGVGLQALLVASGPLVARMLGPDGRGQLAIVTVVMLVCAQFGVGGLPAAISHTVAKAHAPAREVLRGHVFAWARRVVLASAITVCAVIALLFGSSWFKWLAISGFVATLVTAAQLLLVATLLGEGKVGAVNKIKLIMTVLYVGAVVAIFVFDRTRNPAFILFTYSGATLVALVVGRAWLDRPTLEAASAASDAELRGFARRSFVSGIGVLDGLGLDQLLVGLVLGQTALGLYAVAFSITSLPLLVLMPLAGALLPRMASRSPQTSSLLLRRWVVASLVVDVMLVLSLQAAIGPAIRLAFGPEFVPAIPIARILAVAWGLLALRRVLTAAAQAQGNATRASASELISGAVMIACVTVGSAVGGVEGAAVGITGAAAVSCLWLAGVVSWAVPTESSGPNTGPMRQP